MQYVSHRSSSIPVLLSFTLATGLACAATKDARPSPGGESITTDAQAASSTPQIVPAAVAETPVRAGAPASTASAAGKDTAAKDPPVTVPSVKGRTSKDSLALVKAVRAGIERTPWPVKTQHPLSGSILPARRIVAFYGNPLSKKMGILGELHRVQ